MGRKEKSCATLWLDVFGLGLGAFGIYLEVVTTTWRLCYYLEFLLSWSFLEAYYDALALAMLSLEDLAT